jgi:hypothetical protein
VHRGGCGVAGPVRRQPAGTDQHDPAGTRPAERGNGIPHRLEGGGQFGHDLAVPATGVCADERLLRRQADGVHQHVELLAGLGDDDDALPCQLLGEGPQQDGVGARDQRAAIRH